MNTGKITGQLTKTATLALMLTSFCAAFAFAQSALRELAESDGPSSGVQTRAAAPPPAPKANIYTVINVKPQDYSNNGAGFKEKAALGFQNHLTGIKAGIVVQTVAKARFNAGIEQKFDFAKTYAPQGMDIRFGAVAIDGQNKKATVSTFEYNGHKVMLIAYEEKGVPTTAMAIDGKLVLGPDGKAAIFQPEDGETPKEAAERWGEEFKGRMGPPGKPNQEAKKDKADEKTEAPRTSEQSRAADAAATTKTAAANASTPQTAASNSGPAGAQPKAAPDMKGAPPSQSRGVSAAEPSAAASPSQGANAAAGSGSQAAASPSQGDSAAARSGSMGSLKTMNPSSIPGTYDGASKAAPAAQTSGNNVAIVRANSALGDPSVNPLRDPALAGAPTLSRSNVGLVKAASEDAYAGDARLQDAIKSGDKGGYYAMEDPSNPQTLDENSAVDINGELLQKPNGAVIGVDPNGKTTLTEGYVKKTMDDGKITDCENMKTGEKTAGGANGCI